MALRVAPGVETHASRHRRITTPRTAVRLTHRVQRGALARWDRESHRLRRTPPGSLIRWMYCGYQEVNAGDLAAALAYHALIALVPTFLGLVSVGGLVLRDDEVLRMAIYAAIWALPLDEARGTLEALLQARRNSGWFGLLSLGGFAWVGMGFVNAMTRGMNRVYGTPNHRFIYQRLRSFVMVIVFSVLFVVAGLAAALPSLFVGQEVGYYFETWTLATRQGQAGSYLIALAAAALLFLVVYRLLPNAGQRLADVWPGTLVAATLFVMLAQAFPLYIRYAVQTNRFAILIGAGTLLVLWFYLLAHVLLFGAYVNATHQRRRRRAARRRLAAAHAAA